MNEFPADAMERARVVIQIAEVTDASQVADMLAPWIREDAEASVQLILALAAMADKDKFLKQAHAAYVRGERSPTIDEMERRYQRERRTKTRRVARELDSMANAAAAGADDEDTGAVTPIADGRVA